MIGGALGSYTIDAELGSGGMGTVYRAHGADGGAVAVKVVHDHLLALPGVLDRFKREAEVGKAVVHANVVRTLDVGSDGSHFLVMEYVEGQTLREMLAEMGAVPEELCRHIGREIAAALEGIHAAGIIHRDLKPENVLITRDHVVKVMDLGLARVQDEAARLSQAGEFAGSIHYAAPEQFTGGGDSLDGRADLYALGLTLYELATGRHPFGGDDIAALMHAQLNEVPRRVAEVNPQLSPFFEEFVARLLLKDRDERFPGAGDVRAILEQGEDSGWWHRRAGAIVQATNAPLRRIRIPRVTALYGRDEQLAALRTAYDAGGVVLLSGEAGAGKTRLVDELVARLQADGEQFHFLFGSSPPGGAATDAGAFTEAYAPLRAHLEEIMPAGARRAALAAFLEGDAPPEGVPALSRDTLPAAFASATDVLAAERPTIVLIDDLHFAPEEGRALFASLAAAVDGKRVLLVGTMRPGLPADWIGELERLPHVRVVNVPRLGPKDLHDLLADALRSRRLAEQLGGQIAWKSDGNPFFVFEILQGLRDEGLLREDRGSIVRTGVIKELTVPSSLRDLIKARISGLDEDDRNILEVAACAGFEFDPTAVAEALGLARIPLLRRLAHLEKDHRLVHAAGRRFQFDHHQVKEALYEELNELLREEYHAALGEVLEKQKDPDPVALAEHFLKGGRPDRAKPYLVEALDKLEETHRHTAAIGLAARALEATDVITGATRMEVLERHALRHNVLGHYDEAAASFEEMRALACEIADVPKRLHAGSLLGNLYVNVGRYDDAIANCRETITLGKEVDSALAIISGNVILGNALMYQGHWDEAAAAYEEAQATPHDETDPMATYGSIGNLGWVRACAGRYREALALSDRTMALSDASPWGYVINIGYRIAYFRDLGLYDRSRATGEESLRLSLEQSYRWGEATARQELAALDEECGDEKDAREGYEAALQIRREIGDTAGIAESLIGLGRLTGDRESLVEARTRAEEIGATTHAVLAAALLGDARLDLMPRVRRRQAIEAAVALGDLELARALLATYDLPDDHALGDVPLYQRLK